MGLLDRLRAWWRRRFGSGSADEAADRAAGYECAVCGTPVEDPDGECPLCRSTDVVPAGSADGAAADPSAGARERVATADDGAVDRLEELREDGELLRRHADRWQPVDGGFRVETSDGTREVDSREEAAALLRAEAG
jgi:uncharacterized Zn finger protein (UPF0148 family)